MDLNLIYILIISFSSWAIFAWKIRKIQFMSLGTDNERQVYAAAQSNRWKWPSDIHKYGIGKTYMKDVLIFLLSVSQKILHDKNGDRPLVLLSSFCISVSTVLIYLIASNYWGSSIGLFSGILFLISLWSWEIALYGGHINVGTMVFLLAIYFTQQIQTGPTQLWLIVSGFFFGLTLFSSASSVKYIILFLGAIFYEKYKILLYTNSLDALKAQFYLNYSLIFNIFIPILSLLIFLMAKILYKKMVTNMYLNKSYPYLNKMISGREIFSLEYYLNHAKKKIKLYGLWLLRINIFLILIVNLIGLDYLTPLIIGYILVVLSLTLPDIKNRLLDYSNTLFGIGGVKSHFYIYVDYFAKRGITVNKYTRGQGLAWVPKYFWRIIPMHIIAYIVLLVITLFIIRSQNLDFINLSLILFLSLSPILWGELTKGVQIGRAYAPGLVGVLIFIAYALSLIQTAYNPTIYWTIFYLTLVATTAWNLKMFINDVFPARMAIPNLIDILQKRKITEFYTYKTDYNNALVNAIDLNPKVAGKFKINYIKLISEIKDPNAWLVIPSTSSKALHMESEKEGIRDGDFDDKDPILYKLIKTRVIEKIAEAKIKTWGTSRIWVHGSEVSSYRDLILGDVKEIDIFKGYAWLVNINKIKELGI